MTTPAEVHAELIRGLTRPAEHALAAELLGWMQESPRFADFLSANLPKTRKKLRAAGDAPALLDARAELDVARGLLADRRLALVYEPAASSGHRGPDFAVTYRTHTVFSVEVARLRAEAGAAPDDLPRHSERVLRIVLDKLGQAQPGQPNLLVIHTSPALAQALDLDGLLRGLQQRAEAREPAFYAFSRYSSPAAFFHAFLRLSGVMLWVAGGAGWRNPQARPALPPEIWRILIRRAGSPPGG